MNITEEVNKITNDHDLILPIEKAVELKLHGGPGNGSGDRTKICKKYINTAIYGDKREPVTYPKCYDDVIELSEDQLEMIGLYKKERKEKGLPCGGGVIGFIIHGENKDETINRPIRQDIRDHYKQFPCITCGTRKTICDHKNDLYNDPRVLDTKTQTKDDFQPLCNSCNLRKRAVSLKTIKDKKRQPPAQDKLAMNGGIKFTKGDETYDPDDPQAMVGTYWYDPIAFGNECLKINSQKMCNYYSN
jgi:hypothetical protein